MNIRVVLLFVVFVWLSSKAKAEKYFFYTEYEGLYKVSNPFDKKLIESVYCYNSTSYYKPYFYEEENCFIVYGENNSTLQIIVDSLCNSSPIEVKNIEVVKENKDYLFNAPNTTNHNHWFHKIINEDSPFFERIYIGESKNNKPSEITIYLYNITNRKVNVEVAINDTLRNVLLEGIGEKQIKLKYNNFDGFADIKVYSPFYKIGIIKYEYNILDKVTGYNTSFSKYKYTVPHVFNSKYIKQTPQEKIASFDNDFLHFAIIEGEFIRLSLFDTLTRFSNLFIQRKSLIPKILLQECTHPPQNMSSYLIIYNDMFKSKIPDVVDLIKRTLEESDDTISVVNAQSVYDRYSYSQKSSDAIKRYIHSLNPKYVLFIGDANSNESDTMNLIPTFFNISYPKYCRSSTDYPYAYDTDPSMPTIAIGRIPVKTNEELDAYLEKVSNYVLINKRKNRILILDDVYVFKTDTSLLKKEVLYKKLNEGNQRIRNILWGHSDLNILQEFKPDILCHIGHASFSGWSKKNKIEFADFKKIEKNLYFKLIDVSCFAGAYDYKTNTLSEQLLFDLEEKGPVVILSASSYTNIRSYNDLTNHLLSKYEDAELGKILNQVKQKLFKAGIMTLDDLHAFNILGLPNL